MTYANLRALWLAAMIASYAAAAWGQSTTDRQTMFVVLKDQPQRQALALMGSLPSPRPADALRAERQQAAAQIRSWTAPLQEAVAARLATLGAADIRRYTILNMLRADLPASAASTLESDPDIAELVPAGAIASLLDDIEERLINSSLEGMRENQAVDSSSEALARLLDRIAEERDFAIFARPASPARNAIAPSADIARLQALIPSGAANARLALKALAANSAERGARDDRPAVVTDSLRLRFYVGKATGPLQATLVWDRHFQDGLQPYLRNLDLFLYQRAGGAEVAASRSEDANVQRVASDAGEFVLKMKRMPGDAPDGAEPFALAMSQEFVAAEGPRLKIRCTPESGALHCLVANEGDLPAYDVTARLKNASFSLGTIEPASSATFTAQLDPNDSLADLRATVRSESFGEEFVAATDPAPCRVDYTISPGSHTFGPDGGPFTFSVTAGPGACDWVPVENGLGAGSTFFHAERIGNDVLVTADPNPAPAARTGRLVIYYIANTGPAAGGMFPGPYAPIGQDAGGGPPPPPPADIQVTAPTVGTSVDPGGALTIKFKGYPGGTTPGKVNIALVDPAGNASAPFATNVPLPDNNAEGTYSWTVPAGQAAGTNYKIRVTLVGASKVADSAPFTITAKTVTLTNPPVNAPAALIVWCLGSVQDITWSSTGFGSDPNAKVKIELIRGGARVGPISDGVKTSDGKFKWLIGDPMGMFEPPAGDGYQIQITSTADDKIVSKSAAFSLKNELEIGLAAGPYKPGGRLTFTWKINSSTNFGTSKLSFHLHPHFPSEKQTWDVGEAAISGLRLNGTVPADAPAGEYGIEIRFLGPVYPTSSGGDCGPITVVVDTLTLLAPAAGAKWQIGLPQTIQWEGNASPIGVELVKGNKTIKLASGKNATDKYDWTPKLSDYDPGAYKIRVTDGHSLTREADITLFLPKITIAWPAGDWEQDTQQTVTWLVEGTLEANATLRFEFTAHGKPPLPSARVSDGSRAFDIKSANGFDIGKNYEIKATLQGLQYSFTATSPKFDVVAAKSIHITNADYNAAANQVVVKWTTRLNNGTTFRVAILDKHGDRVVENVDAVSANKQGTATLAVKNPPLKPGKYTVIVFLPFTPPIKDEWTLEVPKP